MRVQRRAAPAMTPKVHGWEIETQGEMSPAGTVRGVGAPARTQVTHSLTHEATECLKRSAGWETKPTAIPSVDPAPV